MLLATGDSEAKAASDAETIATLTRDLAAAREELAAANTTVEKCKTLAQKAVQGEQNEPDTDAAFDVCYLALREIITAAEAARENNSRPTRQEGKA
jgi:hypothetical protein